jgi:hypothetical protein
LKRSQKRASKEDFASICACFASVAFLSMLAYLCHPFYLLLMPSYLTKGEIKRQLRTKSKHKATFGYLKHQRCLKGMLAYG